MMSFFRIHLPSLAERDGLKCKIHASLPGELFFCRLLAFIGPSSLSELK